MKKKIFKDLTTLLGAALLLIIGFVKCAPSAQAANLRTREDSIRLLIFASEALNVPAAQTPCKMSANGIVRLKNDEGQPFTYKPGKAADPVLTIYDDNGTPAAGWGNSRKWMVVGESITTAQAEAIFTEDLTSIETHVQQMLQTLPYRVNWSCQMLQPVLDCIISQTYRAGKSNMMASTFWQHLRLVRTTDEFTLVADLRFACTFLAETYLYPEPKADHIKARNQRDVQAALNALTF